MNFCPQRTRDLSTSELLEQLPALQQLLYRLLGCQVSLLRNISLIQASLSTQCFPFAVYSHPLCELSIKQFI